MEQVGHAELATPTPRHPDTPTPSSLRWGVTRTIAQQEVRDAVFGWPLYAMAAVALLVGTLLTYNATQAVGESGLLIVARPFLQPVLVATALAAAFLAGWAALAIARPRDQGALRVLFFAPVDGVSLLAAHALAAVAVYALFMLLTIPALGALGVLVNLPVPPTLLAGILVSPALIAPAIAIGLFVSAIAATSRAAIFLFGVALALTAAIQLGYSALLQTPPESQYYDVLLFLREMLRAAREALRWVSPFSLLSEGLDAALRSNWRELAVNALSGVIGGAVWFALAVWALRRRGVLP